MINILIFKIKIQQKNSIEIERERVGTIVWNEKGTLKIQADTNDIKTLIKEAIERAEAGGVFVKWSEKAEDKRIIEYEKKVSSVDHRYPDLLAEQLFDSSIKIDGYNLFALTQEKYKKSISQWEEIGTNLYRSKFKEEDYITRAQTHLEANEYLFIAEKISKDFQESEFGKLLILFMTRCSEIISQDKPRSRQERPSFFSFNAEENSRKRERLRRYESAEKLLNSIKTFERSYLRSMGIIENLRRQFKREFGEKEKITLFQTARQRLEAKIQSEAQIANSSARRQIKGFSNFDDENLNLLVYLKNSLGYKSLDEFLDKHFPIR